jgi:MerR family transcriptional regulator, light-induced transcriptional regulator
MYHRKKGLEYLTNNRQYNILPSMERHYPIKAVSKLTGLTAHAIRAWEKRYSAVTPIRNSKNRRLYTEEDIERLRLLKIATDSGHSIGQIANLPKGDLVEITKSYQEMKLDAIPKDHVAPTFNNSRLEHHYQNCLSAVFKLDPDSLRGAIQNAAVDLGQISLTEKIIVPLMQKLGDLWREGSVRVAQEHLASEVIKGYFGNVISSANISRVAPKIMVTTPSGQFHEIGAMLAAATASSEGWNVIYLGPNTPADEIAGAARQNQVKVVALSIVYPEDNSHLIHELEKLANYLPKEIILIVGGRALEGYREVLDEMGAICLNDISSFRRKLESLRKRA